MLDLIPDTHAWIKDVHGCFVYGNRLFFERFGFTSLQGLLGKCDYDLAPAALAENYCNDDAQVLKGNVVNDRLELIAAKGQPGDWFLTSKWPIYNLQGRVIGSFGISRHLNKTEGKAIPFRELRAPIDYICQHFCQRYLSGFAGAGLQHLRERAGASLQEAPEEDTAPVHRRGDWTMPARCCARPTSLSAR
ncbi:MAG: PAS domain-containing protein [Haliea sp.]|nr:PAS domain-containing protein [Haliea sp.]